MERNPMTATARQIELLVLRIQGAFLNQPTLRLTLSAAARQFGLDGFTCQAVLGALVDAQVLARTPDGVYLRHDQRQAHVA
jgi:hypothetical protein